MLTIKNTFLALRKLCFISLIILTATLSNQAFARVFVGIGIGPSYYPPPAYYVPACYPTPECYAPRPMPVSWVPGYWDNGYWIPGHYVQYIRPVVVPGPSFMWVESASYACYPHHHCHHHCR